MSGPKPRVRRPLWVVVLGALIGALLVSGILAWAAHAWFALILLYPALIGIAGGLFAWMVIEEVRPDLQESRVMAIAGAVAGVTMYALYHYLRYRFGAAEVGATGWWDFIRTTAAEGGVFTRRPGRAGVSVGEPVIWVTWVIEAVIAAACGWGVARRVKL